MTATPSDPILAAPILAARILVVDDEPEILASVAGYLRRRGEQVITASSFSEGMEILAAPGTPIDILITDVRMPDGSGVDLVRAAIKRSGGPVARILMTGHLEESDLAADLKAAGVKIFYKPFSIAALYREVRAEWEAHRVPGPPPEPPSVG
ncbi:MAG: response regulator [bacterium]|nr:response regulator [bacterium]